MWLKFEGNLIITCVYTEPFYNVEINTDSKTVSKIEYDSEKQDGSFLTTVTASNISIKDLKPILVDELESYARFAVKSAGKTLMVLTLDYKGTNSMSDHIYPYSTGQSMTFAGCSSKKLPTILPEYKATAN